MKCRCEECGGGGRVTCPECNGKGEYDHGIESVDLRNYRTHDDYDELVELQKDGKRIIRQAEALKKMNPKRVDSYNDQMIGALNTINILATKLLSPTKAKS